MTGETSESGQYRSETPARGDCRAIPTSEPAEFDSPVTVTSYQLTNPKNYIGYTTALAVAGNSQEANQVTKDRLINAVDEARRGAYHLDLITPSPETPPGQGFELTNRGQLVVQKAERAYGSLEETLQALSALKRSPKRFTETNPVWASIGPYIAQADPAIAYLVSLLQEIHSENGPEEVPLHELVRNHLYTRDSAFTVEFFFNDKQTTRDKIAATVTTDEYDVFSQTDHYRATVTYQLKSMLYHFGVLTEPGEDTSTHNPTTDMWGLSERLA